jgi:hypothetical protein
MQCAVHCILGDLLRDRLHRAAGLPHEEKIKQKEGVGSVKNTPLFCTVLPSVPDPDPPDPHVFEPPGSRSICQRYGSGSFCHHAKIVRKTLIPTIL